MMQTGKTLYRAQGEPQPSGDRQPVRHNLIVENRSALTATGIRQVISYDEYTATVMTDPVSYTHLCEYRDGDQRGKVSRADLFFRAGD